MKKDFSIYFDIITSLKTAQEIADFTSEIDTFMLTFSNSRKETTERILDSINMNFAKKIIQIFSTNNLNINDKDTVVSFFEALKGLIKKIKVIKLVLAFDPTQKTIENIHNFVKETIGVDYVLDIEVSRDILAGAIIIFNGRYNDSSLKKEIKNTFTFKKKEVLQLYRQ